MRITKQRSINLTGEMATQMKARVADEEYSSENEVIDDGLQTLAVREQALEKWLTDRVVPAYEALKSDPERGIRSGTIRGRLAEEHRKTCK